MKKMSTWTKVRAASMTAAAAVLATACGRAEATPARAAAEPRVVTVVARDFAFEAPDRVAAGLVTFRLQNRGQTLHHMQLVRLDGGKTLQDVYAALQAGGPPPTWMHEAGGPNAPDPGSDANATVLLQPGTYAILCFVDIPDRVPHVMKGMAKQITVTPAVAPAAMTAPTGDVTLTLNDYSFALSQPLTAGTHTLRVVNGAAQPHEVELIRLAPGKTVDDLMAWMQSMQGPPPASAVGGIAGMEHGMVQSFTASFTPGTYVMICFVPDAGDGKPHFMHGMVHSFTVS
jgi:uncharacterized cupredoxin-like copper-binding protein